MYGYYDGHGIFLCELGMICMAYMLAIVCTVGVAMLFHMYGMYGMCGMYDRYDRYGMHVIIGMYGRCGIC